MVAPGRALLVGDSCTPGTGWAVGTFKDGDRCIHLVDEGVDTMSGSLEEGVTVAFPGRAASGLPWGSSGWESMEDDVKKRSASGGRLLLRGHHEHVLADAPASLRWLDRCNEVSLSCGVALSPASMLAPSMLSATDDHLVRMFEYLGARSELVILEDLGLDDPDQPVGCLAGQGMLPGKLLGDLLEAHIPRGVPVVVLGKDQDAVCHWLWPD